MNTQRYRLKELFRYLYNFLDSIYTKWVEFHIALSGYKIASIIMSTMALGVIIDSNSRFFVLMQEAIGLSPLGWLVIFIICSGLLWVVKSGVWEVPTVLFFFIVPIITFYGFLLVLFTRSSQPSLFFQILVILAFVTPIFMVTRTAAFNYYRDHLPLIVDENKRLREANTEFITQIAILEEEKKALERKIKDFDMS